MAEKINRLPVNYDAEKALLASIMIDPISCADYATQLKEDDFALPQNKEIFKAISALVYENKPVDALTVADKLASVNRISEAGGLEYITGVTTSIPSAANADEYFNIVTRNSLLREIIDAGNTIAKTGYQEPSGEKALDIAESTVFKISEKHESSKLQSIASASAAAINHINAVQRGEIVDDGIKTGYPILDKKIESLKPGTLCILAARPSIGKTAFALTIALNAAVNCGKKVAVFSYEMPTIQLVTRMLTTYSQVSLKRQKTTGMLTFNETAKLVAAHEALTNSDIYVDDNAGNMPTDIISKCRRLKNTVGLDLVIIDYMQLINLGEKKENRQQEVSELSRRMKLFAKELNVPFVVLSQLSRGAEQRKEEPQLSDLRESGSIEQDADMVFFLHRIKTSENPDEARIAATYDENGARRFLKFIIGKNRNGELGTFYFDWNGDLQTFKPIDIKKDTGDESAPPVKVNTDIRSLKQLDDDDAFSDMNIVEGKGEAFEIADDEDKGGRATVNEPPFDTSEGGMTFAHNENGDQSFDEKDSGEIPF